MSRKSSIHFKPVSNVRFAVSHSERTDLSEPAYLLPKEYQLDNIVVTGSLSENDLSALFIQQQSGMSRQAKTAGSSPFWEGVVVLPNTDGQEQSINLQSWKKEYEKATGHTVLHMSVHLDEGYLDKDGKPQYNPHAHVIVSRMDSKNRVINLGRKQLANVQDLTSEQLKMERGSTLDQREGRRGRKHIPHKEFRLVANEKRLELEKPKADLVRLQKLSREWSDADLAKVKDLKTRLATAQLEADKVPKLEAEISQQTIVIGNLLINEDRIHKIRDSQAQELAQLKVEYAADRAALKASGEAKQADYQALKKAHEELLATLNKHKREKKNDTRQHPKFAKEPTGILEMQDVFRCDNVHDLQHFEDLLQQDAPGQLRPVQTPADHPDLQQLDPPRPKVALRQEALADQAPAAAPAPMPPVRIRTASEQPKRPQPPPAPAKSLAERLGASMKGMLDWIRSIGAEQEPVGPSTRHDGPVKHMDALHCVQKTGRRYAIHQLANLDKLPALDDPKTEIKYQGGVGQVVGKLGQTLER